MNNDRKNGVVNKIKAALELMRLGHGIMIILGILVGFIIAGGSFSIGIIFAFLTGIFLQASTFALNDYYDVEIDKINNRTDRPLVRGDLAPKTALYLFYSLFALGIICSLFVNWTCFLIAFITGIFAVVYDIALKKMKPLGNIYIAYTMAIPFMFGGVAALKTNVISMNLHPVIFIIALIAFLVGWGREIMKDVMDFEGDRKKGVKSLPGYIGIGWSNFLTIGFYGSAILLSGFPFFLKSYGIYYQNWYYFGIVWFTDTLLVMTSIWVAKNRITNHERKLTLLAMFIGLIAFLAGALLGG